MLNTSNNMAMSNNPKSDWIPPHLRGLTQKPASAPIPPSFNAQPPPAMPKEEKPVHAMNTATPAPALSPLDTFQASKPAKETTEEDRFVGVMNYHHFGPRDSQVKNVWPVLNHLTDAKLVQEMMVCDLSSNEQIPPAAAPLTKEALAKTTGFAPRDHSHNFEDMISNDGVGDPDQPKENIRATQGSDPAKQLLDWDGKTWAPPPVDWNTDRPKFDDSFIPAYVKEWCDSIPFGSSVTVQISPEFLSGKYPVSNDTIVDPIEFEDIYPDIENSCDEQKRTLQTSDTLIKTHMAKIAKKEKRDKALAASRIATNEEIASREPERNPFSPTIEVYVRPADDHDATAIAAIYNYYVENSIIPEDQEKITLDDALFLINTGRKEKLPFIVAVAGPIPPWLDAQGRGNPGKMMLPKAENVVGFIFAERFNYGFSGSTKGRSRYTAALQLYVDPNHTCKGVGRNLIDHIMHLMTSAYAFKNGCTFVNPNNDKAYEMNAFGLWHQLVFQVPAEKDLKDPNWLRLKHFLFNRFFFKEEVRLKSVIRSSNNQGPARFLDLIICQTEVKHELDFDSYI